MSNYAADDYEAIRRRQEEITAERNLALTGSTLPAEEPAYVGMGIWGYVAEDDAA